MQRFLPLQHSRLGIAACVFDAVALIVFAVVALGGISGAPALITLLVVHAVGVVFYLVAILVNVFIRSAHALTDQAAYAAFPLDQWHFMVELVAHAALVIMVTVGYLTGSASGAALATVAIALVSAPALVIALYVTLPPPAPLPIQAAGAAPFVPAQRGLFERPTTTSPVRYQQRNSNI